MEAGTLNREAINSPQPMDSSPSPSTPEQYTYFTPPVKPLQHKRVLEIGKEDALKSPPILKVPASPLMVRLGYGTGVGVYLMERSPKASGEIRSPWAIKKLAKIREMKKVYSKRLEYEASVLKQLNHPNIIGYRAFCDKPSSDGPFLALEKATTSLADLIEARSEEGASQGDFNINPFPAKVIIKVAADMANALNYLHNEKRMIHGDLKSANVLIFGDIEGSFAAKLCDFGVARKLKYDDTVDGEYVGTEVWNPMEVVLARRGEHKYPITAKVDIYPFAMTIYEMISLKPPHVGTCDDSCITGASMTAEVGSDTTFEDSFYEDMLARRIGTRPLLPDIEFDESYNKVLEIFYCCTEQDPAKRPTADEIYHNLCGVTCTLDFDSEEEQEESGIGGESTTPNANDLQQQDGNAA